MLKRLLIKLLRRLTRTEQRDYIREPRIKIMYHPIEETYRWTRLDPKTHIWHWKRKPTFSEMTMWKAQPEIIKVNGVPDIPLLDLEERVIHDESD